MFSDNKRSFNVVTNPVLTSCRAYKIIRLTLALHGPVGSVACVRVYFLYIIYRYGKRVSVGEKETGRELQDIVSYIFT